jgi:large subunit ribosomal protein L25
MRIAFELGAEPRNDQGKGASRRLRHAGKVPAILYGAHAEATRLSLEHHKVLPLVADEKFFSSIISVTVDGKKQAAIVKDVQMHPARPQVVHLDLQRVVETEKIRLHMPIHFRNAAASPGVKTEGGVVSHHMADVEVVCLPKDLPEAIEIDLVGMHLNDQVFLADVKVPEGVTFTALAHGNNPPVVSIHSPRVAEAEPVAEAAAAAPAEGAAAAAPAAAGDAKKDDAKKEPAKKEGGKK